MNWFRKNKWQVLFLTGLVLVSYVNAFKAEFVADDIYGLVNNPEIFKWGWVWQNPLIIWPRLESFLVSNMFGLTEWAFRLTNILAHTGVSFLVLWLGERLVNKRVGMLAGVLTAVHPLMIESVTWISGGGYVKYSFWLILALALYIKAKTDQKFIVLSSLSYLLALQYSEKAVVLPAILIIYRLVFATTKQHNKRGWWDLAPFVILSGIWIVSSLTQVVNRIDYLQTEYSSQISGTGLNFWIQAPIAIGEYLGLALWPDKLTLYHSELFFMPIEYWFRAGMILLMISLGLWGWLRGGWFGRRLSFWLGWILIGLAPTLTPLGVSWVVAERYFYLSAIGVFMILSMLVDWLAEKEGRKEGVMIGFGLVVSLLMIRTLVRNSNWQTPDKLWLSAERTSPNSPQNNNNLGDYYGRMGDLKASEWHFKKALEINPDYADVMHNLANTYVRMGQFDKAREYYQKALDHKPSLWQSKEQLRQLEEYLDSL